MKITLFRHSKFVTKCEKLTEICASTLVSFFSDRTLCDNVIYFCISVPPPKLFAYFNPIQLNVDPITMLWLNAFALNLQRSVKMLSVEQTDPPYLDVKIEAIMFRVSFEILNNFFGNSIFKIVGTGSATVKCIK